MRQKLKFVHKRVIGRLEPNSLKRLVMSEIHCRRPRWYKFEFSFAGNDHRPSQKCGAHWENRNTPDSPDLSPSIPDDREYLRFWVFISWQNLGQSGNSKIPDLLGFSRHMKTRLYFFQKMFTCLFFCIIPYAMWFEDLWTGDPKLKLNRGTSPFVFLFYMLVCLIAPFLFYCATQLPSNTPPPQHPNLSCAFFFHFPETQ